MKKFTIAWVSFFDNVLHIDECYAKSYIDALLFILTNKLGYHDAIALLAGYGADELHMFAFDSDCLIQAKEI